MRNNNIQPTAGEIATGDIGLSSACNAMGVPPSGKRSLQPVKRDGGSDFVRIYLGATTVDGERKTSDLMKQWAGGAESVRNLPGDRFSALQAWSKTRGSMFALGRGRFCWLGTVGIWPCLVEPHDRDEWLNPGSMAELVHCGDVGFRPADYGLAAALLLLGVTVLGVSGDGGLCFCESSMRETLSAEECAVKWPRMIGDSDHPVAYFAAAEYARTMTMKAIELMDPTLMISKGKATAWLDQRKLEEKDAKTLKLAHKIGL